MTSKARAPLVNHEVVVMYPEVFRRAIEEFLYALKMKISTPSFGGKEVDLHRLYVEVTNRGGFNKVVEGKMWPEIWTVFQFPPTAPSGSSILERAYEENLLSFEKMYFLKQENDCFKVSPVLPLPESALKQIIGRPTNETNEENGATGAIGTAIVGNIYGKFEYGYLWSAEIGSETLHGVIYHPAQTNVSPASASSAAICQNSAPPFYNAKRKRRTERDPTQPKQNRTAYNFFLTTKVWEIQSYCTTMATDFAMPAAKAWKNLTEEEKKVYEELGKIEKARYQRQMHD